MSTSAVNPLARLHHLHLRMREIQEQIERGPRQLKVRQQAILQKQTELEAHRQKHKALRLAADQRALQLKTNEAKIGELKVKLNQASSNREFDIFKTQIAADMTANSVLEDEILDTLEKVDGMQIAVRQLEQEIASNQAEEARATAEFSAERPGLEARLSEFQAELTTDEAHLPADVMLQYRRLVQAYGSGALANLDGSTCTSCFVSLPQQLVMQVKAGQIVICKTCGRLLYHVVVD